MRINPILFGVLVVIVFFGSILGFQAAGIWSISGKVSANGEAIQPIAGDVNSIKGWMTLEQISTTFNVPMEEILQNFGLPLNTPPTTAIKDLESESFDTTALKTWLGQKNNPAVPTTKEDNSNPISSSEETATSTIDETTQLVPADQSSSNRTITGKTTFQELLDWGIPKEKIEKIIEAELPERSLVIKDYLTSRGVEFSTIKNQLQTELNKIK